MEQELHKLEEQIAGWNISLGKRDLPEALRDSLENECAAAVERKQQLVAELASGKPETPKAEQILSASDVLCRFDRLADVLAAASPTLGNFELSQHIDKIVCFPEGKVMMHTCKLGATPDAVELFRDPRVQAEGANEQPTGNRVKSRRRGKLRITDPDGDGIDLDALVHLVADTDRFAGLGPEWFWTDEFQVPEETHWYIEHAEEVFLRRQQEKLSYGQLAKVFGVSKPTVTAANKHYLKTHPDAKDEVHLSAGGRRGKRHDVRPHADEIRRLWWDEHWSKLRIAGKYGWSETTVNKALRVAYEKDGGAVPSDDDRRRHQIAVARKMLDDGATLEAIAAALHIAGPTAHGYLEQSFAAEGKPMPDLRSRAYKRRPKGN